MAILEISMLNPCSTLRSQESLESSQKSWFGCEQLEMHLVVVLINPGSGDGSGGGFSRSQFGDGYGDECYGI